MCAKTQERDVCGMVGTAWWARHDEAEGDLGRVQCVSKSSHRVSSGHSYFVRDGDVSLSCLGVWFRGIDTQDYILSHRE